MRYPKELKINDTIGYVAPSCSCGIEPYQSGFERALELFNERGFKKLLGDNVYKNCGIGISNDPKLCADELMDMYTKEDVSLIISCGGGELMCETISYLDLDAIKKANPKWYMGYSDNTNFTFLLTTICDVASIYGYCVSTFGREPWHDSFNKTFDILMGKNLSVHSYDKYEVESLKDENHPYEPFNLTEVSCLSAFDIGESEDISFVDPRNKQEVTITTNGIKKIDNVDMAGRLIGGCLDCLVNLCGTRFDHVKEFNKKYENDGLIWYLESCDLNVFDMRRAMWKLYEAGWFENAKGLIIGRPVNSEGFMGLNRFDAYLKVARELNVPVIFDADIGHVPPMMPIINGAYADVHFADGHLAIDMSLV